MLSKITWVDESDDCEGIDEIRKGMHELTVSRSQLVSYGSCLDDRVSQQTWDWAFGQTPEFTYTLEHTLSWGKLVSDLGFTFYNSCSAFELPLLLVENEFTLEARHHPLMHLRYRRLRRLGQHHGSSWSPRHPRAVSCGREIWVLEGRG